MPGTLFAQILCQQQVIVVAGQVTDELLYRLEAHGAEAAAVPVLRIRPVGGGDDVPVNRAQMLQQVGLLLEHGHAKAAGERLFAGVNAQMGLEVPGHAELFATVLASILPDRGGVRVAAGQVRTRTGGRPTASLRMIQV